MSGARRVRCTLRTGLLIPLFLFAHAGLAGAQSLRFELKVTSRSGALSDTFVATVHIEAPGVGSTTSYRHPQVDGFAISNKRHAHTSSTQIDPVSGQQRMTLDTWVYILRPLRKGRLSIGPARVTVNGRTRRTNVVSVTVADSGNRGDPTARGKVGVPGFRPPSPRGKPDIFLHVVANKSKAFVGEQVVLTWLIYTKTADIKLDPRPPRLTGLWSETLYDAPCCHYYNDRVGRETYLVSIVEKRAVFPTQSGALKISPYAAEVTDQRPSQYRRMLVSSPTVSLQVEPLPTPPPGFDPSYVGEFEAEASVDRTELDAGQPTTLTLVVRGKAAIRRTNAPTLNLPAFRFRSPRDFTEKITTSGDIVSGERRYRYWATPQRGGRQTIPPIRIPFFNPTTRKYEVAVTEPITMLVKGDPGKLNSGASGSGIDLPGDIRPIHGAASISSRAPAGLHETRWYWLLAFLPMFVFAGVITSDVVRKRSKRDGPRARARRARTRAGKRLKRARSYLEGEQADEFYRELAGVICDRVEFRVGEPVGSLTRSQLRQLLADKGFAPDTISAICDELTACDFARFASSAAASAEMTASLERARQLLDTIESAPLAGEEPDDP